MFVNTFLTTSLAESGPLTWDMAKQIIQTQSNLAVFAITVLVAIAVLLVAGSWIWTIFLRKHELEETIKSLKSEMLCESKKDFTRLKKEITDEASKIRQETEKNILSQLTLLEAEKARLFGLINQQTQRWEGAVNWWATAVIKYAECKNDHMLRIMVDGILQALKDGKKQKVLFMKEEVEKIKKCLPYIPKILTEEKEEIEDRLNKISR